MRLIFWLQLKHFLEKVNKMGVDFITCDVCEYNFPDCGEYVRCDCGGRFCSDECAHMDYCEYDEQGELTGEDSEGTCVFCRGEDISNNDLIAFLLEKTGLTREEAAGLAFKASKEEVKND